jgi:hypothetical protein
LATLLMVFSVAHTAWATTRTVTSLADSGAGTLRDTIAASGANDTIDFSVTGTITLASELGIGRNLTITAPGAASLTVSGNNASRVFNITAGTVSISNLTISNGRVVGANGSPYSTGGLGAGGGILNNGTLMLTACILSGNTAIGGTGGNGVGGNGGSGGTGASGAIYNQGSLTLSACTFSGNSAHGGTGGNTSYNSDFDGGGGSGSGGAIYNQGTLVLTACTLNGNSAPGASGGYNPSGRGGSYGGSGSGGGIANHGSLALTNCTLGANSTSGAAGAPAGTSGFFGGGGGNAAGGGIWNDQPTLTVVACTFSGNSAAGGNGGNGFTGGTGGSAIGGGLFDAGSGNYLNTIIANNTVSGGAGGTGSPAGSTGSALGPEVDGTVNSQGHNLISRNDGSSGFTVASDQAGTIASPLNPLLGPLADNGGPTLTVALQPTSAAIDTGDDSITNALATDQRGHPRKSGAHVDIGAVEIDHPAFVVANNNDSGAGSLRQAISDASPIDPASISFATNVTGTITLTTGELLINKGLTIAGPGARVLTVSGNNLSRVIRIAAADVAISGLRISDGKAPATYNGGGIRVEALRAALTNLVFANNVAGSSPADGGGLGVMSTNSCVVHGCTFVGNQGDNGGAISVSHGLGQLLAVNCTLVNNRASLSTGNGGGLHSWGTARLIACTIVSNTAPGIGGVYRYAGTVTLSNCLVAVNSGGSTPDINSAVTSGGYNLIGVVPAGFTAQPGDIGGTSASPLNPLVGPLADNGGPTLTMALSAGSPAIDQGRSFGLTTDQRGAPRQYDFSTIANASGGDGSDIGAFEFARPPLSIRSTAGNAVLSWPSYAGDFTLQQNSNVANTNGWSAYGGVVSDNGTTKSVTVSAPPGDKFYRLKK